MKERCGNERGDHKNRQQRDVRGGSHGTAPPGEQGSCLTDQLSFTRLARATQLVRRPSHVEMTSGGKGYRVDLTAVSVVQLKFAASSVLPVPLHFATFGNT